MAWTAGSLTLLLLGIAVAGYVTFRHFNGNIDQANISPLLGKRPADLHPQAENIMVIGSDTRVGAGMGGQFGTGLTTDQSDTLMVIHIPADRKWAEVISIPRDSYVNIPACAMGNGQLSAPPSTRSTRRSRSATWTATTPLSAPHARSRRSSRIPGSTSTTSSW